MWKSTPVLVELRQDVSDLSTTSLENGDETDYVTIEFGNNQKSNMYFRRYRQEHVK